MTEIKYPKLYDAKRIKFGRLTSNGDILELFKVIFKREFKDDLLEWFAACPTGPNQWYGAFDGEESFYPKRAPKDSELSMNVPLRDLFNKLRVVDNDRYPAFFVNKGKKYLLKIHKEDA
ncbi:hypothetical protein ACFL4J_00850 [Candidatus Margulisiibacteriota bacterium]